MNVAIVGSRDTNWQGLAEVRGVVDDLGPDDVVVSGGARGVDRTAEGHAVQLRLRVVSFRPVNLAGSEGWAIRRFMLDPWAPMLDSEQVTTLPERYRGFAPAAFVRNTYILEWADMVHVFWDGHTRGTKDTLTKARQMGLPIEVHHVKLTDKKVVYSG